MKLVELENEIKSKGYQKCFIAEKLGINPVTFSNKLHGKAPITTNEALNIMKILGVPMNGKNFERLFFAREVEGKCPR